MGLMIATLCYSCQSDSDVEYRRLYSSGSGLYTLHCQNCHGKNGEGLGLLIPPLNDSTYLKKNDRVLACFINNGLKGPVTVAGKAFDGAMPAGELAPIEMAEVLTFVKNSFGNKLGSAGLQQVNDDLSHCK